MATLRIRPDIVYRQVDGVLMPMRGEAGWYTEARLDIVWRGEVDSVEFAANHA